MRCCLLLALLLAAGSVDAAAPVWTVQITEAYLDMRTGPGRGYPVFNTVENGESITVIKKRTGWYKVKTAKDITGWVAESGLEQTRELDGRPVNINRINLDSLVQHRWRAGFASGDFGGANVLSAYAGYVFSPNMSIELGLSQALGAFAENRVASVTLVHQFIPEKRLTPFFSLTAGMIKTNPSATLVLTEDRTDQLAAAGAGVRAWITRRFVFRAEYRNYVVFTSRDENQEIDEWKAGFTFFF